MVVPPQTAFTIPSGGGGDEESCAAILSVRLLPIESPRTCKTVSGPCQRAQRFTLAFQRERERERERERAPK